MQLRPLSCQSYVKLKHICGDALICQVYGSFGVMGIVYKDCSEADNWSIRFPALALLLVFLDSTYWSQSVITSIPILQYER